MPNRNASKFTSSSAVRIGYVVLVVPGILDLGSVLRLIAQGEARREKYILVDSCSTASLHDPLLDSFSDCNTMVVRVRGIVGEMWSSRLVTWPCTVKMVIATLGEDMSGRNGGYGRSWASSFKIDKDH